MKSKALLISAIVATLLSSSVMADSYNVQLDADYFTAGNNDAVSLYGSYYFDKVNTANTAWSEAAFTGRNNNVSVGYIDFDGDVSEFGVFGEFFGKNNNNIYAKVGVISLDSDFSDSDTVIYGEVGYFFAKNWLVSLATTSSDGVDPVLLNTKYVGDLGGGQYFNVEASYNDESEDFSVSGDYYWTAQSSIGLELSDAEGYNYGLRAQHFFSSQFALNVGYDSTDGDNVSSIGVTARF